VTVSARKDIKFNHEAKKITYTQEKECETKMHYGNNITGIHFGFTLNIIQR